MRRLTFSIIFILAAILVVFFLIGPAFETLRTIQAEIAASQKLLAELQEIANKRDELLAVYNTIPQADLDRLDRVIPQGQQISKFLVLLEAAAAKNRLSLSKVDFVTPPQQKSGGGRGALPQPTKIFSELPLSFSVGGTYESFRKFLTDLESSLQLIDAFEVTFTAGAPFTDFQVRGKSYFLP